MAKLQLHFNPRLNWKWWGAIVLFSCGFLGFLSGVEVSERPGLPHADTLTKAYYAFGLFVLGGLDLGTPVQGPLWGKVLTWIAYFGAPILTASAVIETVVHALQPHSWRLRHIKNHIVISGTSDLSFYLVQKICEHDKKTPILLIANESENPRFEEIQSYRNIRIIVSVGDHRHLMRRIRMHRAQKILLLSDNDIINFEAANGIIEDTKALASRTIFHIGDHDLLKLVSKTTTGRQCTPFNSYQLAASHLVNTKIIPSLPSSPDLQLVVLIGFGHFGQCVLSQLKQKATGQIERTVIIDTATVQNADVTGDLPGEKGDCSHLIIRGDIEQRQVRDKLIDAVASTNRELLLIIATGDDLKNVRVAISMRQHLSQAIMISKFSKPYALTTQLCSEHNIYNVNVTELLEDAISEQWFLGHITDSA